MVRGFKTKAEKRSLALRKELGLKFNEPVDCLQLAEHIGICVLQIDSLCKCGFSDKNLNVFSSSGNGYKEFSATILHTEHGNILVYNHFHSQARINSSIAHEISHIDCEHDFSSMPTGGSFGLIREFPKECEEEANWLSGCILFPRSGLVWAAKRGMGIPEIAEHFNTSEEMARWRYNTTGIAAQMRRAAKYK